MKYISLVALTMLLNANPTQSVVLQRDAEEKANMDQDLDALMNKYDDAEAGPKPAAKAQVKADPNTPANEAVQDMELKILSGNNGANMSQKAADDDTYQEVLTKYITTSKKGDVMNKENGEEAANEIFEKMN